MYFLHYIPQVEYSQETASFHMIDHTYAKAATVNISTAAALLISGQNFPPPPPCVVPEEEVCVIEPPELSELLLSTFFLRST